MSDACASCGGALDGAEWCSACGWIRPLQAAGVATLARPAPAAATAVVDAEPFVPPAEAKVDRRVLRTALAAIGLGVVLQAGAFALAHVTSLEPARIIGIDIWLTLALYAAVAVLVLRRAWASDLRPMWTLGDPTESILIGLIVGFGGGLLLFLLARAAAGHDVVDPRIALIVSERTLPRVVGAIALAVVIAPVVEELLFRGLIVEGLRSSGRRSAVATSAVLFAAWHLSSVAFLYYFLMGTLLATLYWKRGLKASLACHAAFNALVVLAAVMYGVGPSTAYAAGGISLNAPATWHERTTAGLPGPPVDLALEGPSGSLLLVRHYDVPGAARLFNPTRAVSRLQTSGLQVPGNVNLAVVPGTARVAYVGSSGVSAVRVRIGVQGRTADEVVFPSGDRIVELTCIDSGSHRAAREFEEMLVSTRVD